MPNLYPELLIPSNATDIHIVNCYEVRDMPTFCRKPDTIEVQQMKAQNKEEKLAKAQEREKLQREIAAREKAEKMQAEYEERFRAMQAEMERRQGELQEAQETIRKLEDQLRETQVCRHSIA